MTERLSKSIQIAETLRNATNAEKSEFDRRLNSYIDVKYRLKNLVQNHNLLQKWHKEKLREQQKAEITFVVMSVVAFAIGYFFSTSSLYEIQSLLILGFVIAIYSIKKDIYEKTYVLEYRMFENEISRSNSELKQYGFNFMYENRITEDEPDSQGVLLEKWHEQRQEAFDELKVSILKSMYLLPKSLGEF